MRAPAVVIFVAMVAVGCSVSPSGMPSDQPGASDSSAEQPRPTVGGSATDCQTGTDAIFQGDFDTGEQGERSLSDLSGIQEVSGLLQVRATESRSLDELACLRRAGGLSISANPRLGSLRGLAALATVDEVFELSINPVLEDAHLAGLERAGELQIIGNPKLREMRAGAVAQVGELYLDDNDALTGVAFHSLQRIGGLYITGNSGLRTLSGFDGVTSLSVLEIVENERLESLEALGNVWNKVGSDPVRPEEDWGCDSSGGGLRIERNAALRSLRGLQGVRYIGGGLCISGNPQLEDLQGLNALISVSAGVCIRGNEAIEDLAGLQGLEFIGGTFLIQENARLETLDGLQRLRLVVRGLSITDNANLRTLDALSGLQFVGALDVSDNPVLEDSHLSPTLHVEDAPN
jgi:hypothetical protein